MSRRATVTVVVPTFNEEAHVAATLQSVARQSSRDIVEILVADGRSDDRTREIARTFPLVTIVDNPDRVQAGLPVNSSKRKPPCAAKS